MWCAPRKLVVLQPSGLAGHWCTCCCSHHIHTGPTSLFLVVPTPGRRPPAQGSRCQRRLLHRQPQLQCLGRPSETGRLRTLYHLRHRPLQATGGRSISPRYNWLSNAMNVLYGSKVEVELCTEACQASLALSQVARRSSEAAGAGCKWTNRRKARRKTPGAQGLACVLRLEQLLLLALEARAMGIEQQPMCVGAACHCRQGAGRCAHLQLGGACLHAGLRHRTACQAGAQPSQSSKQALCSPPRFAGASPAHWSGHDV